MNTHAIIIPQSLFNGYSIAAWALLSSLVVATSSHAAPPPQPSVHWSTLKCTPQQQQEILSAPVMRTFSDITRAAQCGKPALSIERVSDLQTRFKHASSDSTVDYLCHDFVSTAARLEADALKEQLACPSSCEPSMNIHFNNKFPSNGTFQCWYKMTMACMPKVQNAERCGDATRSTSAIVEDTAPRVMTAEEIKATHEGHLLYDVILPQCKSLWGRYQNNEVEYRKFLARAPVTLQCPEGCNAVKQGASILWGHNNNDAEDWYRCGQVRRQELNKTWTIRARFMINYTERCVPRQ